MLPNGHFRFEIPYKVLIGESLLDVEEIGKSSLALQINNSTMHPRGDAPETSGMPVTKPNSVKYWEEGENFWTMREINLPNSVKTISEIAMAFVPFTTLKSYGPGTDGSSLKTSADGFSKIWNLSYTPTSIVSVQKNGTDAGYTQDDTKITITGDTLTAGVTVTVRYWSDSADKFRAYLRNNQLSGINLHYATAEPNTVDFIGQRIIEDTETDKRKGMGVFSIVTTASKSDDNSTYAINELGSFVIKKDNTDKYPLLCFEEL